MARFATRVLASAFSSAAGAQGARFTGETVLQAGFDPQFLLNFRFLNALLAIAFLLLLWWMRERRIKADQESLRAIRTLGEEIIAAPTPADIAERLATVLPVVTQATSVNLYLFQRRTKSLERVATTADPEPMAASIDAPPEGLANAAVVCFRNRTLLNIPDVRRNPLVRIGPKMSLPRSAMFVALFSSQETLGVLEIGNARRTGFFTPEEQAAVQHLANLAAASLKLQERQVMREQLFHSEKLAATGQLISGVVSELRAPLDNIVKLATELAAEPGVRPSQKDLQTLTGESQRAAEIVSRLVSFAEADDRGTSIVDVNSVAAEMIRFREPEWRGLGLHGQNRLPKEYAPVLGSRGQIEQVLLNLLVHAEHHAGESAGKSISAQSSIIAQRVVLEIEYSTRPDNPAANADPFSAGNLLEDDALGLGVCQGIVRSHGGDVRFRRLSGAARFELEFPIARDAEQNGAASDSAKPSRPLTLMLVDPDPASQRQLLGLLSLRGHRAVPAAPHEAIEICQRLRFDAVFWALQPNGSTWTESQETIRANVPVFVAVSDSYVPELARHLERSQEFLLPRPIQEAELDRILATTEARSRSSSNS